MAIQPGFSVLRVVLEGSRTISIRSSIGFAIHGVPTHESTAVRIGCEAVANKYPRSECRFLRPCVILCSSVMTLKSKRNDATWPDAFPIQYALDGALFPNVFVLRLLAILIEAVSQLNGRSLCENRGLVLDFEPGISARREFQRTQARGTRQEGH